MNIVIVGDGKVGHTLAERLSDSRQNTITVVDNDIHALKKTEYALEVNTILGNGARPSTQRQARSDKADLFIATTDSDERNIVCCLTAKKLGAKRTIARIRDPQYADELRSMAADFEIDYVINPEQIVAGDIARHLAYQFAYNIEMFARGRAMMLEMKVTPDLPIVGRQVVDVNRRISSSILIGAILRGETVEIPKGESRILAGDHIFLVGSASRISSFCDAIGVHREKAKSVMIIGGGRIAYYLAKQLYEENIYVKIIEVSKQRADELAELLPGDILIVNDDGTDDKILLSENLAETDAFVAVTGIDEENIMTALFAKSVGVPEVIAKTNHIGYSSVIKNLGIDYISNPKELTTNVILRYIRGLKNASDSTVNTLYPIVGGKAEAIEFTAGENTKHLDIPLSRLQLIPGVLVGIIVRRGEVIIPFGKDAIKKGDNVIIFSVGKQLSNLNDIFVRVRD
ncbi:MAG: Trk system potassium transporter TrkA [Oscillospiraceae bacterium]|jgi:trk system potassium uptake protein TrkA|nr:Trk system potassium transporter TrkA [Oscillospiraceae bacterium]